MSAIPDDPEQSTYRFIIVAAKRARQLQNGARSFLPTTSKKPTIASMEEVRRGSGEVRRSALATQRADQEATQSDKHERGPRRRRRHCGV